jgi:hypothetical protein
VYEEGEYLEKAYQLGFEAKKILMKRRGNEEKVSRDNEVSKMQEDKCSMQENSVRVVEDESVRDGDAGKVLLKEMQRGVIDSHNILCVNFVAGEVECSTLGKDVV